MLLRALLPASGRTQASIRVVSLNCAGGDPLAMAEVAAYRPDIVLLQEAPPGRDVVDLAGKMYGVDAAVVTALAPSIIVRGKIDRIPLPRELTGSFAAGIATLPSGVTIEIVSLRLTPAVLRMDLFSPDCWREQTGNRRERRVMLQRLTEWLETRHGRPLIVGGDFNAPQGDAVFSLLRPGLRDAFSEGGDGWPNTIINDYPFLRIDQVWLSRHFRCIRSVSRRTIHSDHRMVVCDLEWTNEPGA
jgi:vancomycin resistance protein VanJ